MRRFDGVKLLLWNLSFRRNIMKLGKAFLFTVLTFCFSLFLSATDIQKAYCTTYTINFDNSGFSPSSMNVQVGDVIQWSGDWYTHVIQSTSVPSGASSFGPTNYYTTSLSYTITTAGTYYYQDNTTYYTGSFTASSSSTKAFTLTTTTLSFGSL